ncbi:iron-sulfur cluster assembly accessory protein [Myxococcus sp. K38C18041901]|uniref:HesB/IscA family protein n=1 Tax=Myxococcus guangdongensis TaxID=2906760 RepID=UPI0020A71A37|nr:iron-sulfur cluster assembly accessory protein [Myxococcus guangdongensis]MCP3057456.1 iron-sulfur cluster assembly accessory protein [Myxococcus guangdongensis]
MSEQATQQMTPGPVATAAPVAKAAPKGIVVADSAVARLKELLEQRQTPEAGLRLAVKGGGCSGLQYSMEWSEKSRERDKIFERDGVRVFVDPKSYLYLIGTELVFEQTLMASGFKLNNPNIKAACGCGESFSV